MATELKDIYSEYVLENANLSVEAATLENRLLMYLYHARENAITNASIVRKSEGNDPHVACTHRYVRAALSGEFGIKDEGSVVDSQFQRYSFYKSYQLDRVRQKIFSEYNTHNLVKNLSHGFNNGESKLLPYLMFQEWFTDKGVHMEKLWDMSEDGSVMTIKQGAIVFFLEQNGIVLTRSSNDFL